MKTQCFAFIFSGAFVTTVTVTVFQVEPSCCLVAGAAANHAFQQSESKAN